MATVNVSAELGDEMYICFEPNDLSLETIERIKAFSKKYSDINFFNDDGSINDKYIKFDTSTRDGDENLLNIISFNDAGLDFCIGEPGFAKEFYQDLLKLFNFQRGEEYLEVGLYSVTASVLGYPGYYTAMASLHLEEGLLWEHCIFYDEDEW